MITTVGYKIFFAIVFLSLTLMIIIGMVADSKVLQTSTSYFKMTSSKLRKHAKINIGMGSCLIVCLISSAIIIYLVDLPLWAAFLITCIPNITFSITWFVYAVWNMDLQTPYSCFENRIKLVKGMKTDFYNSLDALYLQREMNVLEFKNIERAATNYTEDKCKMSYGLNGLSIYIGIPYLFVYWAFPFLGIFMIFCCCGEDD